MNVSISQQRPVQTQIKPPTTDICNAILLNRKRKTKKTQFPFLYGETKKACHWWPEAVAAAGLKRKHQKCWGGFYRPLVVYKHRLTRIQEHWLHFPSQACLNRCEIITHQARGMFGEKRTIVHVCSLPMNTHTNPAKAADFMASSLFLSFRTKNTNIYRSRRIMSLNLCPEHTDLKWNNCPWEQWCKKQASKFLDWLQM